MSADGSPMDRGQTSQTLVDARAAACRSTAASSAEFVGGGLALVFCSRPDAPPALLAAAGFVRAGAAREAARIIAPSIEGCLSDRALRRLPVIAALGDSAAGDVVLLPLDFDGTQLGVLAVGAPAALDTAMENGLLRIASDLAVRLDHVRLREHVAQLEAVEGNSSSSEENQSDEILKLSEALFAQDIELLRNNEKLGKIEELKNDFIEKMSRELRTPLNSIIEAIISVLTGEDDALSDGAKTVLRSALDSGTAFVRTLQNILDLWRIKQGELPVEIHDVNFREVVEEAVFSVQDAIGGKPLTIEQHIEEPFPKFRTDLTKVNQALFLLLDNAVKFTPRGQINIHARVEGDRLYCEVRDTGVGMCQDDTPHIFDEFFQVDDTEPGGAGLGLALVRDLMVLLDGGIAVQSEVGRGTSVTFDVPIQVCS